MGKRLEFKDAGKQSTEHLMRELPRVRLLCPDTCHSRNPRDSYHVNKHKSKKTTKYECVRDGESAHSSFEMDDDGSDSDSDWEEHSGNLRKKRSGGGRGTKRKRASPDIGTEDDTEDDYCRQTPPNDDTDDSPCY